MQHAIDPSPGTTSQAQPMRQPPRTLRLLLLQSLRSVSVLTDHPHLVLVVSMFLSLLNPTCPVFFFFFLHPRGLICVAQVEIPFFVYSPINFLLVETQRCVLLDKYKNNSNCRREPFFVFPVITQRAIGMVAFGWASILVPNSSILYSTTSLMGQREYSFG